jgi:hypothetical protein
VRYLDGILLVGAAAFVAWWNHADKGSAWFFPFEVVVPSLKGKPVEQGDLTVALFGTLGIVQLVRGFLRARADRDLPPS